MEKQLFQSATFLIDCLLIMSYLIVIRPIAVRLSPRDLGRGRTLGPFCIQP